MAKRKVRKEDRHGTGAFYTPSHVTANNASTSLNARILEGAKLVTGGDHGSIDIFLSTASTKELRSFYFDVLCELTVLDPACGDGAFLIPCLDILTSHRRICLEALRSRRSRAGPVAEHLEMLAKGNLGPEVLEHNILGVDLDEDAVKGCRANLVDVVTGTKKRSRVRARATKVAERTIRTGNSLFGFVRPRSQASIKDFLSGPGKGSSRNDLTKEELDEAYLSLLRMRKVKDRRELIREVEDMDLFHWPVEFPDIMASDGFDVVIGNPPYGDRAMSKVQRDIIRALGISRTTRTDAREKGSLNPSSVFLERWFDLVRHQGQMALIVPMSMTRVQEFERVRGLLLDDTQLWQIVDEGAPFKGITLEMFSLFARKERPTDDQAVAIWRHVAGPEGTELEPHGTVPARVFRDSKRFMLYWDETYERVLERAMTDVLTGRRGPTVPKGRFVRGKDGANPVPLLVSGKAVQRYRLVPPQFHWTKERVLGSKEAAAIHSSELLVGTRLTDRYRVTIKPKGYLVADNIIRLETGLRDISLEALCVLLNSRLMHYVVRRYLFNDSRLTLFIQSVARATPIRVPGDMSLFTTLGRVMLGLGNGWPGSRTTFERMDRTVVDPLVYELYLFGPDGIGLSERLSHLVEDLDPPVRAERLLEVVGDDHVLQGLLDTISSDPVVKRIEAWSEKVVRIGS